MTVNLAQILIKALFWTKALDQLILTNLLQIKTNITLRMITHRLLWSQLKQILPNNQISMVPSNMEINVENPNSESLFIKYCSLTRKCSSTRPKTYSTSLNRRLAISIWPAVMNLTISPQKIKAIGIHKRKYNLTHITLLRYRPCPQAFVS